MKTNRRQFLQSSATAVAATAAIVQTQGQNAGPQIKVPTCPTAVPQPTPDDFSNGPLLFRQVPIAPVGPSTGGPPASWNGSLALGCGPCGIAKEFGPSKPSGASVAEYLDDDDPNAAGNAALTELVTEFGPKKPDGTQNRTDVEYYEIVIEQNEAQMLPGAKTQFLGYGAYDPNKKTGLTPGPMFQARVGRPMVVRFINRVNDYMSVHLHGGHGPAHSDGHPAFIIPKVTESGLAHGAAGYGSNHRDYFYPHTVPAKNPQARIVTEGRPGTQKETDNLDYTESPSSMWYHDHSMDITGPHVQMGLAGFCPAFDDHELRLLGANVLPFCGKQGDAFPVAAPHSSAAAEAKDGSALDDVFEAQKKNPLDLYLVLQDRCFSARPEADGDPAPNQLLYSVKGHNGHLGHHVLVNGKLHPRMTVVPRKYRLRVLDGSNARIYKLALYARIEKGGVAQPGEKSLVALRDHLPADRPEWFRIGTDTWLFPRPVLQRKVLLAMAKRADMIVDFKAIDEHLRANAKKVFGRALAADENIAVYLCNLLDQESGRGPKLKLPDGNAQELTAGTDGPIAVPNFQAINVDGDTNRSELGTPWPLMKFTIESDLAKHPADTEGKTDFKSLKYNTLAEIKDASVTFGTRLRDHTPIRPDEIMRTREVIFERGNGIWQINGKVVDEFLSNFVPELNTAECWILENGGGGWWHPIHIHLEAHQQIEYLSEIDLEEFKLIIGQIIAAYEQAVKDETALGHVSDAFVLSTVLGTLKETLAPFQNTLDANGDLTRMANDEVSLQKLTKASVKKLGEYGAARGLGPEPQEDTLKKPWLRLKKLYGGVAELVREFAPDLVFEDHRIWDRVAIPEWDSYKSDTSVLGPNTRVKVFMKFRTFDGPFVFHCHNLEHEDMRMMFTFDPRPTPPGIKAAADATISVAAAKETLNDFHLREQPVVYRHPWRFSDTPAFDRWAHTDSGPANCSKTPPWNSNPPVNGKPRAHPIWGGWDQHI